MKEFAVIVAGGKGMRMQSEIPKQYLLLDNYPIIFHTIRAFYRYSKAIEIILVIPKNDEEYLKSLQFKFKIDIPYKIVHGGHSRFQSVANGLKAVREKGLIAVHDGVRPLITHDIIKRGFVHAAKSGSAITAMPLKESIRSVDANGQSKAEDRSLFRMIQTPQTFRSEIILEAFKQDENPLFTDEASVVESLGIGVELIKGCYENIKITTPEDLLVAKSILEAR